MPGQSRPGETGASLDAAAGGPYIPRQHLLARSRRLATGKAQPAVLGRQLRVSNLLPMWQAIPGCLPSWSIKPQPLQEGLDL